MIWHLNLWLELDETIIIYFLITIFTDLVVDDDDDADDDHDDDRDYDDDDGDDDEDDDAGKQGIFLFDNLVYK